MTNHALEILTIPCLQDNYSYLVHCQQTGDTVVIDPSESSPIVQTLDHRGWRLSAIWNTHHHWDHVGGNVDLKTRFGVKIHCSKYDLPRIEQADHGVDAKTQLTLGPHKVDVIEIPGHTLGHIAFYIAKTEALFCGDTLFSLGCGRLFEGTPEVMWQSLQKLKALPDATQVYCGHEYTLSNGRFAQSLNQESVASPDLLQYLIRCQALRLQERPTIPFNLGQEKQLNPFLNALTQSEFTERRLAKDRF